MSAENEKFAEIMANALEPQRAAPEQAVAPQQMESMGFIQAATEGIKEFVGDMYPGFTLGQILGDIGHELKEQVAHGAHEAAAALFTGSSFVMYPHAGKEQEGQAQPAQDFNQIVEAPSIAPITPPVVEMERDMGRER